MIHEEHTQISQINPLTLTQFIEPVDSSIHVCWSELFHADYACTGRFISLLSRILISYSSHARISNISRNSSLIALEVELLLVSCPVPPTYCGHNIVSTVACSTHCYWFFTLMGSKERGNANMKCEAV